MTERQRADLLLIERRLFKDHAGAQDAIRARRVFVGGIAVRGPSDMIATDALIDVEPAYPWVSRSGVKLAAALKRYPIDIEDHVCVDVGAGVGGFTEVLLNFGASLVYAVELETNRLDPGLHDSANVITMDGTDVRWLAGKRLEIRPDIIVIDVCPASLKLVLPAVLPLAAAPTHLLALIRPKLEVAPAQIEDGIVRDEAAQRAACDEIAAFAAELGCEGIEIFPSAIPGEDGNREFFIGARRG